MIGMKDLMYLIQKVKEILKLVYVEELEISFKK
jgi:hypothetical protein